MLLDTNILIYAANQSMPEIESLATSTDSAVTSVTRNEDDFKHVGGLRVINPFAS